MIFLLNQELVYQNLKIDLAKTPLKKALLNAFLSTKQPQVDGLNHDQLVEIVYQQKSCTLKSKRMKESNRQRLNKLIVRTRRFMENFSKDRDKIEWLPYHRETKSWTLYRRKP